MLPLRHPALRTRTRRLATLLLLAAVPPSLLPTTAAAQRRDSREQATGWISLNSDLQLSPRWFFDTELNIRMSGPVSEIAQAFPRLSLRYQPAPSLRFNWGYAFVETWPYGKLPVALRFPEHRMWQQVQVNQGLGRVAMTHRYRLEQRWLGRTALEDAEPRVQDWVRTNRFRYRVQATIPFQGRTLDDGEFYANVSDEVFLNWGANVQRNVFDQNRLAGSIGRRLSPSWRVELGYLEQLLQKADGRTLERNHTVLLSVFTNVRLDR
jgi:hypothetical protein